MYSKILKKYFKANRLTDPVFLVDIRGDFLEDTRDLLSVIVIDNT